MTILMLISALTLSSIAAFYAVIGLVAVFAAAPIPIAIMGTALEGSKLVVASWLYRNWKMIPWLMKSYLTFALVVLMMLTSMGIFGFLSKAHIEQGVPTGDVAAKAALIEERIQIEKENINAARNQISQLDSQVNQLIGRSEDTATVNRSIAVRKNQAGERRSAYQTIEAAQAKISELNTQKAPLASQLREIEAEVGPIKYIAALVYGDNPDQSVLEKSVRLVTILIVIVFDPLAIIMLIAANWSMVNLRKKEDSSDMPISVTIEEFQKDIQPKTVEPEEPLVIQHPQQDNPVQAESITPTPEQVITQPPEEHLSFQGDSVWKSRTTQIPHS